MKLLVVCCVLAVVDALRVTPPSKHQTRRDAIMSAVAGSFWSLGASAYDSLESASRTGVPSAQAPPPRQLDWNDLRDGNAVGKYGKPPPQEFKDPEVLRAERMAKKAEREKKAKAKNDEADVLIAKIQAASEIKDADKFAEAMDELSLWIIKQGPPLPPPGGPWADILQSSPLPEGFETRLLIKECKEAIAALPRVGYTCEKTRDNGGVCFSAGRNAEGAFTAMVRAPSRLLAFSP